MENHASGNGNEIGFFFQSAQRLNFHQPLSTSHQALQPFEQLVAAGAQFVEAAGGLLAVAFAGELAEFVSDVVQSLVQGFHGLEVGVTAVPFPGVAADSSLETALVSARRGKTALTAEIIFHVDEPGAVFGQGKQ